MRATKKALSFIVIASMLIVLWPQTARAADVHDVSTPEELTTALGSTASGDSIRLLADIDYNTGIMVTGRTIIFDMNGHTLTVVSSTGNGLEVGSGGIVDITGSGVFNAVSTADNMSGVYAHDGGQASVTSATATGDSGYAAYARDAYSLVEVAGDVTGECAAFALGDAYGFQGGTVRVGGNATATGDSRNGANASGVGGLVEVAGDVTGELCRVCPSRRYSQG